MLTIIAGTVVLAGGVAKGWMGLTFRLNAPNIKGGKPSTGGMRPSERRKAKSFFRCRQTTPLSRDLHTAH